MEALKSLWASRKAWSLGVGSLGASLPQLVVLYLALTGHLKPGEDSQVTHDVANIISLLAALWGALVAALTAVEDAARKWGVTSPPLGEHKEGD